ncbi:MAG TPA: class I SAM-dependent methyltransferase [Steroidobacteraceae bacterium]|jgi:16S rRNA (guanine1207-N2)-methyltransferase|nr:class I SAM-dependent methyltransferase [Steroidobacteraceae bacterium]
MCADRSEDRPLETLFLPLNEGHLAWPASGALFLRARAGVPLQAGSWPGLACHQTFAPDAAALERLRLRMLTDDLDTATQKFPLVLILPPRQRDEARALLARALRLTERGGRIVACMSNDEGARSGEADLERIVGPLTTLTKNKCRVFWSAPLDQPHDDALVEEWLRLDAVRPIADGRFVSRPGVFAWDRIDVASQLLAEHLPSDLAGRAADLGAGFGYLSVELLQRCARIAALDLYEAERRALDLARRNLAALESRAAIRYCWHDVTAGLTDRYDVIVCNPPFHTHARADRPDIGRRFIATAAQSLLPGGRLWLVANRHLPYEQALGAGFERVRIVTQQHGFKIVEAMRAKRA